MECWVSGKGGERPPALQRVVGDKNVTGCRRSLSAVAGNDFKLNPNRGADDGIR